MRHENPALRHLNIDILVHGYMQLDKNWYSDNARNFFTRLYLITSGSGYLRTDAEVIEMRPGNIYLIPSEYDFGFGCESLEKVFFHILLPNANKTDILSGIGKILTLSNCEGIISELLNLYEIRSTASLLRTKLLVYTILDRFTTQYQLQLTDDQQLSPLVEHTMDYIWEHLSIKLTVKEIAAHLDISESNLRNTFRSETGMTVGAYMDDAIFFTVRKMLAEEYSVNIITSTLDFCDRNYLSRRFRERFGKTISQYRQELLI
jgi:AraC-like DNA-binding protein